jgi:hypothetical protein
MRFGEVRAKQEEIERRPPLHGWRLVVVALPWSRESWHLSC